MKVEEREDGFWVVGEPNGSLLPICKMKGPFDTEDEAKEFIKNPSSDFVAPMSVRDQTEIIKEIVDQRSKARC